MFVHCFSFHRSIIRVVLRYHFKNVELMFRNCQKLIFSRKESHYLYLDSGLLHLISPFSNLTDHLPSEVYYCILLLSWKVNLFHDPGRKRKEGCSSPNTHNFLIVIVIFQLWEVGCSFVEPLPDHDSSLHVVHIFFGFCAQLIFRR